MIIDKQRIAAVATLQGLGYTFEWMPRRPPQPPSSALPSPTRYTPLWCAAATHC
jgi:hypothetical protein